MSTPCYVYADNQSMVVRVPGANCDPLGSREWYREQHSGLHKISASMNKQGSHNERKKKNTKEKKKKKKNERKKDKKRKSKEIFYTNTEIKEKKSRPSPNPCTCMQVYPCLAMVLTIRPRDSFKFRCLTETCMLCSGVRPQHILIDINRET